MTYRNYSTNLPQVAVKLTATWSRNLTLLTATCGNYYRSLRRHLPQLFKQLTAVYADTLRNYLCNSFNQSWQLLRYNFSTCELSHRYSFFYVLPTYVSELSNKSNIKINIEYQRPKHLYHSFREFRQSGNDLASGGRSHLVWFASSEELGADHYIVKQQNHQISLWPTVTLQKLRTSSLPLHRSWTIKS